MAKVTLRDVIDQAIERAWQSGAESALIHAGWDSRDADKAARRSKDPVWQDAARRSVRREQARARDEILAAIISAAYAAVEQARLAVRDEDGRTGVEVRA